MSFRDRLCMSIMSTMSWMRTRLAFVTAVGVQKPPRFFCPSVFTANSHQKIFFRTFKPQKVDPSRRQVCTPRLGRNRKTAMSIGKEYDRRAEVKEKADMTKLITVITVFAAVLYFHNLSVILYALGSIMNLLIGKMLKKVIRQPRPDGATKIDHGMPSSHATSLSFLTFAALFGVARRGGLRPTPSLGAAILALLLAGIATRWRVAAGYHTTRQVAAGWVVGCIDAILWCFLVVPTVTPLLMKLF